MTSLGSLAQTASERKMQCKLLALGLKCKYAIKESIPMAPDVVLNKKSTLDIQSLGLFMVHLLFGVDCLRAQSEQLTKVSGNFELSQVTLDFLRMLLAHEKDSKPAWNDVVNHAYIK